MLGQSHCPAKNDAFGFDKDARCFFYLAFCESRLFDDVINGNFVETLFELWKLCRVVIDELMIEHRSWPLCFRLKHLLHQSFEQRDIAVDPHLQEEIGELRTAS